MTVYRLNEERLTWREVEGAIVAINVRTSEYLTVNSTGRVLWLTLAAGASEDQLVDVLLANAQIDEPTARRDVASFVDDMRARGLVSAGE